MNKLRWVMVGLGVVLIALTLGVAAYARFAGDQVGAGYEVRAGHEYYLVASGAVAHCESPGGRFDIQPFGARELLDGARVTPPADGLLRCDGGDVTVTDGLPLVTYPLAEFDFIPVLLGAALIVLAKFVRPARRRQR